MNAVQLDLLREQRAPDEIRHTHCLTWEQRAQFGKMLVKVSPKISREHTLLPGGLLCLQGPVKSSPRDSEPRQTLPFQICYKPETQLSIIEMCEEPSRNVWAWSSSGCGCFQHELVPGRARAVLRHKHIPARTAPLLLIPSRAQQSH